MYIVRIGMYKFTKIENGEIYRTQVSKIWKKIYILVLFLFLYFSIKNKYMQQYKYL